MKVQSFTAMKRAEARERMASLRRTRQSRTAAWREQKAASLFGDASKWRVTNLAAVLSSMAEHARR